MSNPQGTAGNTTGQGFSGGGLPSTYEDTLARRWRRRRATLAVLTGLVGIILAMWLGRVLERREHSYAKAVFIGAAARWTDALQRSVTDRVGRVTTTVAAVRSSDINDRKDFRIFVSQLTKNITSIEMLGWAPRIPAARQSAMKRRFANKVIPIT